MTLKSGLEVTQVIQNVTIRNVGCAFLFAFHSNYGYVLYRFRDKVRYWLKMAIFLKSPLY